jgi:hypothetical protein
MISRCSANRSISRASKGRVFLTVKATVQADVDHSKSFNHAGLGGLLMIEWE